ncbi:hypothetical protein VMCG_08962 [Cytospora schulzeri]|uniref:Uncharacterized protein n=1 Tax=Cytospora schulzeri TaxID=448051 RepID=A0A423VNL3_9PEZI|nr:hypothetical protein VMCG_08962 [Valsa malicola]
MPDRRVIYDSEDEDAGFSPLNSPARYDALEGDAVSATEQPQQSINDTRSTDPDFFRKVYDEQQSVAAEVIPDSARDGNGNTDSSGVQKSSGRNAKDNSSSLTDPTSKSAKKGSRLEKGDFASLTQVTTPRADAPAGLRRDVYDFPTSGDEGDGAETKSAKGKAKATKIFSKRKRGEVAAIPAESAGRSSPARSPSQDGGPMHTHPRGEDELPRPTKRMRKSGTQQSLAQIPEDVDLLVIPRTADMEESPAKTRESNEDLGSIVPDTLKEDQSTIEHPPASFFIAPPSRLTASQKQEYVRISGSSDHDDSLPTLPAQTQDQQIRSSEATIPYTTPSRYCVSTPRFSDPQEPGDRGSSGTTTSSRKRANISRTEALLHHSSPDELGSHSPNQALPKAKRRRGEDDDDELAQDDAWDSDEIGVQREQYVPRPSRGRTGIDPDEDLEGSVTADNSGNRSMRNKRLKTGQHGDVAQEDPWDSDKIGAHREAYKPRPSRRRSRAVVQEDAEENAPEQSMPDTCPFRPTSSEGMEGAGPILISSGQQAPQQEVESVEGIDPDYLAALPRELRQEVISDHLARNAQAASRTRGRGRPSSLATPREETEQALAAAEDDDAQSSTAPLAPAKRKRGRPKKSETGQPVPAAAADEDISFAYEVEDVHQAVDDSAAEEFLPAEPVQAPVPAKATSKRGRKKKVVEEPPSAIEEEPPQLDAEDVPPNEPVQAVSETAKAPSKRGRRKKIVEDPPADVEDGLEEEGGTAQDPSTKVDDSAEITLDEPGESVEEADASRLPLQDVSNTSSSKDKEVTPEAKAKSKETPRSASSTTGQGQGKVPLRVGLSKRTRIAPLLKIIRK